MKYMLLIHQGDAARPGRPGEGNDRAVAAWESLSEDEQRGIYGEWQAISETPGVTAGAQLQPPETAVTVRVENGKPLKTDGPFAETKEALGGYLFFEADDIDAAVELASRIPTARLGGAIEVRPLLEW